MIRKHGWKGTLLMVLALIAFAAAVMFGIYLYDGFLERRFGKGSWGAALGIPAMAILLNTLGAYLKSRQPPPTPEQLAEAAAAVPVYRPADESARRKAKHADLAFVIAVMIWSASATSELIAENMTLVGASSYALQLGCMAAACALYVLLFVSIAGRTPGMWYAGVEYRGSDGAAPGFLRLRGLRIVGAHPGGLVALRAIGAFCVLALTMLICESIAFPDGPGTYVKRAQSTLGRTRPALNMFCADNRGCAKSPHAPEFIDYRAKNHPEARDLPTLFLGNGEYSDAVEVYSFTSKDGAVQPAKLKNTGHWAYDPRSGVLIVDSTADAGLGRPWYSY
jgi:hypothetical protein